MICCVRYWDGMFFLLVRIVVVWYYCVMWFFLKISIVGVIYFEFMLKWIWLIFEELKIVDELYCFIWIINFSKYWKYCMDMCSDEYIVVFNWIFRIFNRW